MNKASNSCPMCEAGIPLRVEQPIVTICAWCYPGYTVLETRPDLKGYRLSHGMCPHHFKEATGEDPGEYTNGIICKSADQIQ